VIAASCFTQNGSAYVSGAASLQHHVPAVAVATHPFGTASPHVKAWSRTPPPVANAPQIGWLASSVALTHAGGIVEGELAATHVAPAGQFVVESVLLEQGLRHLSSPSPAMHLLNLAHCVSSHFVWGA
jgi:hypothetical protein